jgi:predicted nucleic acid-binding protein
MIYLDSSYLAKLYIHEHGSQEVERWLDSRPEQVVCCLHGRLEVFAALKRQQREQRLKESQMRAATRRLETEEKAGIFRWLPIDALLMSSACLRMQKLSPAIFLRAADALHLACAADAGLKEIYSHDRHLLAAAPHFGLRGLDVITPKKSP